MTARLRALRDDGVGTGRHRRLRFGDGRHGGEPGDAARFHRLDESRLEQAHDRRDDGRAGFDHRFALRREVLKLGIPRIGGDAGAPFAEKVAQPCLMRGIALRRRIGHPDVHLERAVGAGADLARPIADLVRRPQQRARRAHAAGLGHRDRQRRRTGAGHRRHQDRHLEIEAAAEGGGAFEGGVGHGRVIRWHGASGCRRPRERAGSVSKSRSHPG